METISMSSNERKRLVIVNRVRSGEINLVRASEILGVSYRQMKRIFARFEQEGDAGLVHGLRGRASNRQPVAEEKEKILALYQSEYSDYGPTLAAESLDKDHQIQVPVTTLRRWLSAAGLWQRHRKRKLHRRRRPRREQRGELLQMDGSHHNWFEDRRDWAVLMVMVDDATGTVDAAFFENESWDSAAESFRGYVLSHGVPQALYVDCHSIYRPDREPTPEELLAGQVPETQFGRAMRELGVELILAGSPQAKGRVERMNRTFQDRLVKALRRANISDLAAANEFLVKEFLPAFNAQFAIPPHQEQDGHQALPASTDLSRVLSIQEQRIVQNDWTARWNNAYLQLPRAVASVLQPGQSITVCQPLRGPLRLFHGDQELSYSETRTEPSRPRAAKAKPAKPTGSSQGRKPAPSHPWRGLAKPPTSPAAVSEGACSASPR